MINVRLYHTREEEEKAIGNPCKLSANRKGLVRSILRAGSMII